MHIILCIVGHADLLNMVLTVNKMHIYYCRFIFLCSCRIIIIIVLNHHTVPNQYIHVFFVHILWRAAHSTV